jgi:divalent metal cation (Fe/Co/Zn/Cd) transporter
VYEHADAMAALVVAVVVICISFKLGRRSIDVLLDRAPKGLAERLSRSVEEVSGIERVSRVRVRSVGDQVFVDLTVDVPRHLSFEESHRLTQEAQAVIHRICPSADVVVHAVPIAEREGILEKIQAVAARGHVSVHNVTTHWTERGMWIDLDLEVDPGLSFEQAHGLATNLETKLRAELIGADGSPPVADINVHIEPQSGAVDRGAPLDPLKANSYIQRVEAIGRELEGSGGSHHIELHEINGAVYLSLHLLIHAGTSIAQVHRIAEEMENRLRREFPELGRVVIHTEPFGSREHSAPR